MIICFAGDVRVLNDLPLNINSTALERIKECTELMINLEAPVTESNEIVTRKWAILKQPPKVLPQLKRIGVTILNLANNHMMDYGTKGLLDTLYYSSKEGLLTVGAGENTYHAWKAQTKVVGKKKVSYMGFSCTNPPGSLATKDSPGIAGVNVVTSLYIDNYFMMENPGTPPIVLTHVDEKDLQMAVEKVKDVKEKSDFLVVNIHWGVPFQKHVVEYQVEVGRKLIDAGADLIIGHHPHVVQAVEIYKNRPVFYSIGHFMFTLAESISNLPGSINPFPPNVGDWGMSPINIVVKVLLDDKPSYEILFVHSDEDKIPRALSEQEIEHQLKDLYSVSKKFNTEFLLEKERVYLKI